MGYICSKSRRNSQGHHRAHYSGGWIDMPYCRASNLGSTSSRHVATCPHQMTSRDQTSSRHLFSLPATRILARALDNVASLVGLTSVCNSTGISASSSPSKTVPGTTFPRSDCLVSVRCKVQKEEQTRKAPVVVVPLQ